MTSMRFVTVCAFTVAVLLSHSAAAQDLSRYRDVAFGSSVASVAAITGATGAVKLVHQRPALIQEMAWRPQYALARTVGRIEAAREITFRFYDDQLYSITVVYEARLVEGLTNEDIIEAVSAVYGPPTLSAAGSKGKGLALPPPGAALARWPGADHEFTLMRQVYPATFRLIGVSRRLESLARAAETEATRLDEQDAPRRAAERAVAEAEHRKATADKMRTTNKGEFQP